MCTFLHFVNAVMLLKDLSVQLLSNTSLFLDFHDCFIEAYIRRIVCLNYKGTILLTVFKGCYHTCLGYLPSPIIMSLTFKITITAI